MEAVDCMWVNIWCMLDAKLDCWILSQSCRNTHSWENTFSSIGVSNPGFCGGSSPSQPPCYRLLLCCTFHFIVYFILLPQPRADPGHIALPSHCTRHFSSPIMPWHSAESIYMIPTMGSSPSFFLRSLAIQFPPWPKTISLAYGLTKSLFPDPVTI